MSTKRLPSPGTAERQLGLRVTGLQGAAPLAFSKSRAGARRSRALVAIIVSLLCSLSLHAHSAVTAEQVRLANQSEQAMIATVAKLKQVYVFIGGGSGVLISADGLMLTNFHVAGESQHWSVRVNTKMYEADTVGSDPRGDIVLLKLKDARGLPFVEFADSDKLFIGQRVIAVGNPFATADVDGDPTITQGIISGLHRYQTSPTGPQYTDAIQTDAAINPGNSGGPLLTIDGKLAGINGLIATKTAGRANSGIGYAIPAAQIKRFLPLLKEAGGKFVYHGFIRGFQANADESDGVRNGAEIKSVDAGSYADKLGFKAGDRVIKVGDYPVLNFARFFGALGTYPSGSLVPVLVDRGGKTEKINATLEAWNQGSFGLAPKHFTIASQQDLKNALAEKVVVDRVYPELAAAKAGVQTGDVIVGLGDTVINNIAEWGALAQKLGLLLAGDKFKLKVQRTVDGKTEEKVLDLVLTSAWDESLAMKAEQQKKQ